MGHASVELSAVNLGLAPKFSGLLDQLDESPKSLAVLLVRGPIEARSRHLIVPTLTTARGTDLADDLPTLA
jgi:hypothetical protein